LIYYRDNAKWLERTYDFVPRLGIEKLRKVLIDDELGLCDYFDREVEATIAAYVDPWLEREKPAFAGQFEETRTIPLPVPSDGRHRMPTFSIPARGACPTPRW